MSWESRYLPPGPAMWTGRVDTPADSCFYQHIQLVNLAKEKLEKAEKNAFAIIGFKCDEGTRRDGGKPGTATGPDIIRERLAKLPIQRPSVRLYDVGNITCTDQNLEASQSALADIVSFLLKHNIRPIVIGGGHELAFGHYQGIANTYSAEDKLGIINFDAHFDLKPLPSSKLGSGSTTFYQIAEMHTAAKRILDYNCIGIQHAGNIRQLFDIAKKYNTKIILADELHQGLQEKCFDFVDRILDQNDLVYLSLSLDVFSSAFAPGVSSAQPLGLNPWHIIPLIRQFAASAKVVSYDIAEYVPDHDIDHRTAKLAAMIIYEIIHHHNEHPRTW